MTNSFLDSFRFLLNSIRQTIQSIPLTLWLLFICVLVIALIILFIVFIVNKKTNAEQERVRKHIGTRWEGLDDILKTIGCSLSALGRSRIQLGTYRHTQVSERFSGLSPKSIKEGQERAS